ncbi:MULTISPECIES: outer membrane protein [unclassified Thioalkalivibrio]|uniref:outer membrane protein n=1 Tax=unclassified Thioalkalivibrio TaxID=2621013 RepID=UPI000377EC7E|nr:MULTISPECIES: outer membrane beta-barrel protein [unclassified Thioalkalivibrio]
MEKRIISAATIVAIFGLGMAQAQASGFNGGYVGGQIGGASYDIDTSVSGVGSLSGLSGTGVTGGIFAGYGGVSDGGVYGGIEIDAQAEDADASVSIDGEGRASVEARHSYGVTGRIGGLVSDNVLVYGLLGYQRTDVRSRVRGPAFDNASETDHISGPRIGAGVEVQRDDNWFMRGEVSYTAYSSESYGDLNIDPGATRVQFGIGYRF